MFPTKSVVKDILSRNGWTPSKQLGQNFLIEQGVAQKILSALELNKQDAVLEIGPGLGGMTFILSQEVESVWAIELDKGFARYLNQCKEERGLQNLTVVHQDVLQFDFSKLGDRPFKVLGNLPYSITGPLLMSLLEGRKRFRQAVLMMQKEVAKKLFATVNTTDYNRLSVYFGLFAQVKPVMSVAASCFYPRPRVDSMVVCLDFEGVEGCGLEDEFLLRQVLNRLFGQKRKMVGRSLRGFEVFGRSLDKEEVACLLENVCISPEKRPQELEPCQFVTLTNALKRKFGVLEE